MKRTIIFLNGFAVPIGLSKTKFVWDDSIWKDYNRLYYTSKIPTSDQMVARELDNLANIISQYDNPIVAGHSLGSWWATNLAAHNQFKTNKMVLWTPLGDHRPYPIFNATHNYVPHMRDINPNNCGKNKVLLTYASHDLIVPPKKHISGMIKTLNPTIYKLYGGHIFQINHKDGLSFMKEWVESE